MSAPKSSFSCGPSGGEKLLDPWASGRKGQECPREIQTKNRGPKTRPKSKNTQKTLRSHELFRKVRANFCLLLCGASQEPNGNCSEKLVQMNFFILGWIFSGDFSFCEKKKFMFVLFFFPDYCCNLCGHLQRCQMPDIENNQKTVDKGAELVTVKQPKNSRKNSRNTRKTAVLTVFRVFRLFFRLFYRNPLGTLFGCFSAIFNVGHLARRDCKTIATMSRNPSESHSSKNIFAHSAPFLNGLFSSGFSRGKRAP